MRQRESDLSFPASKKPSVLAVEMTSLQAEAGGDVEDGAGAGWRFWQANEKKTDGPVTQPLMRNFLRKEAEGEFGTRKKLGRIVSFHLTLWDTVDGICLCFVILFVFCCRFLLTFVVYRCSFHMLPSVDIRVPYVAVGCLSSLAVGFCSCIAVVFFYLLLADICILCCCF